MASELQRLRIANICYANVSSSFAMFCNPEMRGPNFRWGKFTSMMVKECDLWLILNNVKHRDKTEIVQLAQQYTEEIANRMVEHSGLLKAENSETLSKASDE